MGVTLSLSKGSGQASTRALRQAQGDMLTHLKYKPPLAQYLPTLTYYGK